MLNHATLKGNFLVLGFAFKRQDCLLGASVAKKKFYNLATGCGSRLCHPESTCHRVIVLIMMCCLGFGSYFCYDNPAALQVKMLLTAEVIQLGNNK